MTMESYTRWRSGGSDDEDDEGGDRGAEGTSSAVTIITKQRTHPSRLTRPAQTRVAAVMVLMCLVSAGLGMWMGWVWAVSCPHYPINMIVPAPRSDYNHSHPLLSHLRPSLIKDYMRKLSGVGSDLLATMVEGEWREQGLETSTTTFTVDLSRPDPQRPNTIEIAYTNGTTKLLNPIPEELHSSPFSAFSPAGVASGQLVYGHYGLREDLSIIQSRKILLKGSIFLLRLGKLNAGAKVRNAVQAGASAVLLYPDPEDKRGDRRGGEPYPNGTGLPDDGVLWESLSTTPGDPSTPFLPSLPHVYRAGKAAQSLPSIPAQTISADTARELLALVTGPDVPVGWAGGLAANYTLGGSWAPGAEVANLTVTVNNVMERREVKNIHATMPASDEARVVMVGCHYGSLQGGQHSGAGLGALLALSDALAKSYLPRGTQRKVVFSAWAAGEDGWVGSTEFTQLHPWWVESSLFAYLGVDALLQGTGAMRVSASPALREAIREAASQVWWPAGNKKRKIDARDGWRLSDPFGNNDVYFYNLGSGSDFVSFTAQRGVPSAHFAAVGSNWKRTYSLRHSQYDDFDAYTRLLDPTMEWTHMITSLVGATLLVLSESEVPPLVLSELSGDLYNGWQEFLRGHSASLANSGHNFTGILDAIEKEILKLEDMLTVLDGWYKTRPFYVRPYPQHYPGEDHRRQVEQRLWWLANLERGLLGPRGVGRSFTTHLMLGPDPEDPDTPLHFPHAVTAITHALQQKTPWESVHQELSYVLAALASYRQLFPGDPPVETAYTT